MKLTRKAPSPTPAPEFTRQQDAPHRAPATQESCGSDYQSGSEARKGLGKPAENAT